jgi:hypothetical protein
VRKKRRRRKMMMTLMMIKSAQVLSLKELILTTLVLTVPAIELSIKVLVPSLFRLLPTLA